MFERFANRFWFGNGEEEINMAQAAVPGGLSHISKEMT